MALVWSEQVPLWFLQFVHHQVLEEPSDHSLLLTHQQRILLVMSLMHARYSCLTQEFEVFQWIEQGVTAKVTGEVARQGLVACGKFDQYGNIFFIIDFI